MRFKKVTLHSFCRVAKEGIYHMSSIIEKLEAIKARFDDLGVALTNPEVVSDNKRFTTVSKEYRKLEKVMDPYKKYRACLDGIAFGKEVLETESDPELRQMAAATAVSVSPDGDRKPEGRGIGGIVALTMALFASGRTLQAEG